MQAVGFCHFARRALLTNGICNHCKVQVAFKSKSSEDYFKDPGSPRVAVCKDGQTIAMYHPAPAVEYEKTIPIPRENPKYSEHKTAYDLARQRLKETDSADRSVQNPRVEHGWPFYDRELTPTVMELAEMFYTSKHRWYVNRKRLPKKDL